ncbi:hypothetical protein BH11PSE8_BH11PSE8_12720 [soil metagenome]
MSTFLWNRSLRLALGIAALAFSGLASAQLVLYEDDNYSGRQFRTNVPMNDLANVDFNDKVSSVVVRSGTWQLCVDADFRGQCVTLGAGSYPSLSEMGLNDRVSSVRPMGKGRGGGKGDWGGGGAAVQLYEHSDYNGRSITSDGSRDLVRQGFNDRVSSIVIRSGRWEFCSDADFRGTCVTLGPGSYADLRQMNLNDEISSFRASAGPPSRGGGRPNHWKDRPQ